jgi:hypothetical protein
LEKTASQPLFFAMPASGHNNNLLQRIKRINGIRQKNYRGGIMLINSVCITFMAALFLFIAADNRQQGSAFYSSPGMKASHVIANLGSSDSPRDQYFVTADPVVPKDIQQESTLPADPEMTLVIPQQPSKEYANVDLKGWIVPKLNNLQQKELDKSVAAIEKVVKSRQWEKVEKELNDQYYSMEQKDSLKNLFSRKFDNLNLGNLTQNLRLNFNSINWEPVDQNLRNELAKLKLDSMIRVNEQTIQYLQMAQEYLNENKMDAFPDSDMTLQQIEKNKRSTKASLQKLQNMRHKKIVHI